MQHRERPLMGDRRATVTDLRDWLRDRPRRPAVAAVGAPARELAMGELATGVPSPRPSWPGRSSRPRPVRAVPAPAFSLRERTVLALIGETADDEELSGLLGLDEDTLRGHLDRILRKYAAAGRPAPTRAHLALRALQDGHDEAPVLRVARC